MGRVLRGAPEYSVLSHLIEPPAEHLGARGEVEVLIDDLPILPGLNWTRKEWITQETIFSIETEPETAVDVNEWAAFGGGSPILTSLVPLPSRQYE